MTTTTADTSNAIKPALAWSSIAIVLAGYLWALLYVKGQGLLGFGAFVVALIVLIFGLRKPVAAVSIVVLVALIAAAVGVHLAF